MTAQIPADLFQTTGHRRFAALLAAMVGFTYLPWIGVLPACGEETRWAMVAREMASSGDWIVPRQQGVPFLSRPPLGSWLMAAAAKLRGQLDLIAVRLPTALAVVATSLLVFWYAAKSLPTWWAFNSGLAFATSAEVLHLGRLGETDMDFTACVAGSMLLWRGTWSVDGPTVWSWSLGYGFAALAALAKGAQGPTYFVAAAMVYLFMEGRGRWLFSRQHAIGVCLFVGILGAWLAPLLRRVGCADVVAFWTSDVALRWEEASAAGWAGHLFRFPLEVGMYFLPWSVAVLPLARRDIRRQVVANPFARFAVVAICVALPTCWLTPNAKVRYFLPLFPQMAIVAATVLWAAARSGGADGARELMKRRLWAIAAACGLGIAGLDVMVRFPLVTGSRVDAGRAVEELKAQRVIAGSLSSIGPVHHRFAFFCGKPIKLIPEDKADAVREGSIFTVSTNRRRLFEPPFPYEALARVPCDSVVQRNGPIDYVVVARRLPAIAAGTPSPRR